MTHSFAVVPVAVPISNAAAIYNDNTILANLLYGWPVTADLIEPDKYFKWSCSCGASGNLHDSHQRAFVFGSQHLRVEGE